MYYPGQVYFIYLISDGSLLVVTLYDPLFLLLQVLQDKAGHHFVSLDTLLEQHIQSLEQDDQDMTSILLELFMKQSSDSTDVLLRVCDRQGEEMAFSIDCI